MSLSDSSSSVYVQSFYHTEYMHPERIHKQTNKKLIYFHDDIKNESVCVSVDEIAEKNLPRQ